MAKQEVPEPPKQVAPPPPPEKKAKVKKEKPQKPRLDVPPMVDLVITVSRSVVVLLTIFVALITINAGNDLRTIVVRTMAAMIVFGLIMWVVSWAITEQYLENFISKAKEEAEKKEKLEKSDKLENLDDSLMKDAKA